MNRSEQEMIDRLESMPLSEARRAIATGLFGDIGSPNHAFCTSWLQAKDAELLHARESESLDLSKQALGVSRDALGNSQLATRVAIIALIVSVIAFALQFIPRSG